jgi:hypothetical protein
MCGRPVAAGAVACLDCVDFSFDAVGYPREGDVMSLDKEYETELVNTVQVLRARLEVSEAVRAELEAKCGRLERGDSTRLVLGILAFIFVMSWLCLGTVMDWAMHN